MNINLAILGYATEQEIVAGDWKRLDEPSEIALLERRMETFRRIASAKYLKEAADIYDSAMGGKSPQDANWDHLRKWCSDWLQERSKTAERNIPAHTSCGRAL